MGLMKPTSPTEISDARNGYIKLSVWPESQWKSINNPFQRLLVVLCKLIRHRYISLNMEKLHCCLTRTFTYTDSSSFMVLECTLTLSEAKDNHQLSNDLQSLKDVLVAEQHNVEVVPSHYLFGLKTYSFGLKQCLTLLRNPRI